MTRDQLKSIIRTACDKAGISTFSTDRTRLVNSADLADRIAVGTYKITQDGLKCGCPATVAGLYVPGPGAHWTTNDPAVQRFPEYFDALAVKDQDALATENGYNYIPVTD